MTQYHAVDLSTMQAPKAAQRNVGWWGMYDNLTFKNGIYCKATKLIFEQQIAV